MVEKEKGPEQTKLTESWRGSGHRGRARSISRAVFDNMNEGFALCEIICDESGQPCDFRYLEVNPAFERYTGVKGQTVAGRTLLEVFPAAERMWIDTYGKVVLSGEPAEIEGWFGPLERWFKVSAFQSEPGRFGAVFTDITERKRAEDALGASEEAFHALADNTSGQHRQVRPGVSSSVRQRSRGEDDRVARRSDHRRNNSGSLA